MVNKQLSDMSISKKLVVSVVLVLFIALFSGTLLLNSYVKKEMTTAFMDSVGTLTISLQQGVKDSLEKG